MYNIPLYKQKLYSIIKERYNLKSNAQAGQKIRSIKKDLSIFSFWSNNPLKHYVCYDDMSKALDGFRQYIGYRHYNFPLLFIFKGDECIPFFANDDIKLLYHIYNNNFVLQ